MLVLTTYDADEFLYRAMRAGPAGSCSRRCAATLVHAIQTVAAGGSPVHPALIRRLLDEFTHRPPPGGAPAALRHSTRRELDVRRLVAHGQSNAEIAGSLHLSEAAVMAYESGFVCPGRR